MLGLRVSPYRAPTKRCFFALQRSVTGRTPSMMGFLWWVV